MFSKAPVSLLNIVLFFAALALRPMQAQSDGFTVQERAGIALVKPQAWSKDSEAVVLEFQAFTDRTASGVAGAGYIEFHTKGGNKRQVPAGRIVKVVVYPDPNLVKEVLTDKDRNALAAVAEDLKATVAKHPATRSYVEPALKKVTEEVEAYDSGKVKTGGVWLKREIYVADRARTFASQIKPDILRANPPSSFDLANDPRFIALEELAKTNAGVKPLVTEISEMHGKRVRAEQRANLLIKLAEPSLSLEEARTAVARLRTLQPEEDPRAVLFLKNWDAGQATAAAIAEEGKKVAAALEAEMSAIKSEDALPEISSDLGRNIASLNSRLMSFLSTKPPAPLVTEVEQAQAVCTAGAGFGKLKPLFDERQYLEIKDVLDGIEKQSSKIGPETTRVVVAMSRVVASSITEFSRLREEAKVLADANKPAEALAVYEKAYAVIPDPTVGEQIALLKEKLPKKK
jgi:hypothetical protein